MSLGRIPGVPFTEPGLKRMAADNERRLSRSLEMDSPFASILTTAERSAVHDDADSPPLSRLPKEKILQLVQEMQMEMNLRLLRSLSEPGEDHEFPKAALRVADGCLRRSDGTEASKNQQHAPKSDASALPRELAPIIRQASETYGVDQDLIRAVIKVESNFQVTSTSPKGAMGLMQLIPATAYDMGVTDPYDPVQNIMGGTRYLKGLLNRYQGDIPQALAAYNWGAGNVEKYPDRLPRETRDYIRRVTEQYQAAKV